MPAPLGEKLGGWGTESMADTQEPNPWRYAGVGLELVAVVLVLMWVGYWLDGKLDTSPWLMLTGALLGIVGGLYNLVRDALKSRK